MTVLVEGAKQIVICMVLTTLVENLLRESEYRKYIRLFMGFLMILLVLKPVSSLFSGDFDGKLNWNEKVFSMEDDTELLLGTDEKRREMLEEEYEKVIENRVGAILQGFGYRLSHFSVRWSKEEAMQMETMELTLSELTEERQENETQNQDGEEGKEKRNGGNQGTNETENGDGGESAGKVEKVKKREKISRKHLNPSSNEETEQRNKPLEESNIMDKICSEMGLLESQVKIYVE